MTRATTVNGHGGYRAYSCDGPPSPQRHGKEGCVTGAQFPAPFDCGYGFFGFDATRHKLPDELEFVDKLRVPAHLSGDYVLQWRYSIFLLFHIFSYFFTRNH